MPGHSKTTVLVDLAAHFFLANLGRYIAFAGLLSALVWVLRRSRFRARTIQDRAATAGDRLREFGLSLATLLVYALVGAGLVAAQRLGIVRHVWGGYGLAANLALLAAMIVAHDAYFYWIHRAMHHRLLFRLFHRAHHRSITPTPFAAYAFALPEATLEAMFLPLWALMIPTPDRVMLVWLAFQLTRNVMIHAGFELMPRWWLASPLTRWITATTHHDLHHAGGFGTNYGLYFTWWDKWMRTEHPHYAERFATVVNRLPESPRAAISPAVPANPAAGG